MRDELDGVHEGPIEVEEEGERPAVHHGII
jgi:hypothetical protein